MENFSTGDLGTFWLISPKLHGLETSNFSSSSPKAILGNGHLISKTILCAIWLVLPWMVTNNHNSYSNSNVSSNCNSTYTTSQSSLLTILYYNAQSLIPKLDELSLLATAHNPDIICIVEILLEGNIDNTEISIPGYHSNRLDRSRHGGGVLLYVKNLYQYTVLLKPNGALELLSVVVQHNITSTRICVSVFYRPPNFLATVLDDLCTYFVTVDMTQFANFIVVGDFNTDMSSCSHPLFYKLSSAMSTHSLFQMVSDYTHVHHNGSTSTIDLLFTSNPQIISDCSTIPPLSNSDHLGLLIHLCLKPATPIKTKARSVWRYSFADWDKACEMIEATNWMALLNHSDIDKSWLDWKNAFMNIMEECIPKTTILPRRNWPWLTKRLRQAIRRKNALYKCAKVTGRNKVTSSLRQAKKEYFQKLNAKNSKQFWKN